MNAETIKLIETMAAKLGTTSEYLWGVLLKQAPISAAIDAAGSLLLAAGCVWLARLCNRKVDSEDWDAVAWIPVGLVLFIFGTITFYALFEIPTALLNPEYWALAKLLGKTP